MIEQILETSPKNFHGGVYHMRFIMKCVKNSEVF